MNSSEYQVTVKSANHKVDDYVTKCNPIWTVKRLKQHISETHVNKPRIEDQRLIYAGNLLKDSFSLKQIFFRDSLCTELTNSNKTEFTIHLVCHTHPQRSSSGPVAGSSTGQTSAPSRPLSSTSSSVPTSVPPASTSPTQSNTNQTRPSTSTTPAAQQAEMVQNLMQSDQMRQQMAIFQQLACVVAAQIAQNVTTTRLTNHQAPQPGVVEPVTQFGVGAQMQAPAPVVEQPAPQQDQGVPIMQHDVIDWVYYSIRAAVLMAALYIHASMFRLLFIVGLLAVAYFFNRRRVMPGRQDPQPRPQVAGPQAVAQEDAELRRRDINREGGQQNVGDNNNNVIDGTLQDRAQDEVVPGRVPFLKLCCLVITDFLASLVPE